MNRSELISRLMRTTGFDMKKSEQIIDVIFETMVETLASEGRIEIRGFGSFAIREYEGYLGRNPKTNESHQVPAKKRPFFKVGKELKEYIDQEE